MKRGRVHSTSRTVRAGCDRCGILWTEKNAQAVAAQHTDRRKHRTWVEQVLRIEYGSADSEPVQSKLF